MPSQLHRLAPACLILLATGCQGVYTRTKLAPMRDERVLGEWYGEKETEPFTVRLDGEGYAAESKSGKKDDDTVHFILARVGGEIYAQFGEDKPCDIFPGGGACYGLARLALHADEARLFMLDTGVMFSASLVESLGISYEMRRRVRLGPPPPSPPGGPPPRDPPTRGPGRVETDFLLLGDEPEIRSFLAKHGSRFTVADPILYRRKPSP